MAHCQRSATSDGVGSGLLDGLRVGAGPVPADDLRAGMVREPGREGLGGAVGQHVHDPAGFGIDEHGAVSTPFAEGELVDPQHPWCTVRHCRGRQQREQPGPARAEPQAVAQTCGRPASSTAIDRSQTVSPRLERRCRSDRPATCSTNVRREQLPRSQKYRRTRSRTMTRREPNGRSFKVRWYELCTRIACFRQPGHRPGRPVDIASTTRVSEELLTRSTRTSIPGNSTVSTVSLVTPARTVPKRYPVMAPDLGIHGTAGRANFKEPHQDAAAARRFSAVSNDSRLMPSDLRASAPPCSRSITHSASSA